MVNKIFLAVFVLFIALGVIGCIKIEKTETIQDSTDVSDDTSTDSTSTVEDNSKDIVSSTTIQLPSDLVSLMEKGRAGIRNVKYVYRYDPFSQEKHGIIILGDRIKYELPEEQRFFKHELFDTVYLDIRAKTAVAYCEHLGRYKCLDPNKPFDVNFEDFISKNDGRFLYSYWYDIIENNEDSVEIKSSQQIFNRKTYVVEVLNNGIRYTIHLDSFSGMVLRVVEGVEKSSISNDGDVTSYEPEGLGKVIDTDVEHQRIAI